MKKKLFSTVFVMLFVCSASTNSFGNWQQVASSGYQPRKFQDWVVSVVSHNTRLIIIVATANSDGEMMSIALAQGDSGQKFVRTLISSPSTYKPLKNGKSGY